jgi:hypothetical protein
MIPKKINNENKYKIGSKRAEDHDRMDDRSISPLSDSLRSLNDNFPESPDQKSRLIKERKSYIPTIRKPDIVSQTSSG